MAWVTLLDSSEDICGFLDGEVTYPDPLYEIASIDVRCPRYRDDGAGGQVDQRALVVQATECAYDGEYYRIRDIGTDEETFFTIQAEGREVELASLPASMTADPAVYHGKPSEIFTELLGAYCPQPFPNGRFEELDADGQPVGWYAQYPGAQPEVDVIEGHANCMLFNSSSVAARLSSVFIDVYGGVDLDGEEGVFRTPKGEEFAFRCRTLSGSTTNNPLNLSWYTVDLENSRLLTGGGENIAKTNGNWAEHTTADITADGDGVFPFFTCTTAAVDPVYLDNVEVLIKGTASAWSCSSSDYDTRNINIPITDTNIYYGDDWTLGANYITSTVSAGADYEYLTFYVTGPGAIIKTTNTAACTWAIRADGDLVHNFDLDQTDTSVTLAWDDGLPVHKVEIINGVGTLNVGASGVLATQSLDNVLEIEADGSILDAINAVLEKTGGEIVWNRAARTFTHEDAGADLEATNVLRLEKGGPYLLDFQKAEDRSNIENRLKVIGNGGILYYARSTDTVGGSTSETLYGVRYGEYTNTNLSTYRELVEVGDRIVEERAFPLTTYDLTVTDAGAVLISPGDTVHVIWEDTDVSVRVLSIDRSGDGSPAKLTVGARRRTVLEDLRWALT